MPLATVCARNSICHFIFVSNCAVFLRVILYEIKSFMLRSLCFPWRYHYCCHFIMRFRYYTRKLCVVTPVTRLSLLFTMHAWKNILIMRVLCNILKTTCPCLKNEFVFFHVKIAHSHLSLVPDSLFWDVDVQLSSHSLGLPWQLEPSSFVRRIFQDGCRGHMHQQIQPPPPPPHQSSDIIMVCLAAV